MIETIYIEEEIASHPRTEEILARFPDARKIHCERYGEVFNRKSNNFRNQKQKPALILAKKHKGFVLPTPAAYGIGATENYYFSHMMNCLYDCRYCFLQGMYQSAHYVLFVNYEDFADELSEFISQSKDPIHFFSGYDCDSLALEPISKFLEYFLPFFAGKGNALLEIRTKSTQVRTLLENEPLENVVVAWSFTPTDIADALEHKTPSVQKRIDALLKLQDKGWKTGLRFDPLIYSSQYQTQYQQLFEEILTKSNPEQLHSVSMGSFRLPKDFFKSLKKMYPEELLFASPLEENQGMVGYKEKIENEMLAFCKTEILKYIPENIFFPCHDAL